MRVASRAVGSRALLLGEKQQPPAAHGDMGRWSAERRCAASVTLVDAIALDGSHAVISPGDLCRDLLA